MFIKKVSDMRMVIQRVSFSPESGGVWNPKMTMLAITMQGMIRLLK